MKTKILLLGDEAFALGAINAGLSGAYAYPGTPSTEILEYIQGSDVARTRGIHSHWSSNEKTAVEEALGMSFCGKRSLAAMKHVGVNVAADPLINSAMTGANGGMIVVAADDPSMHSSQNEQDSRYYAHFAMLPMLEPSDQQEAYLMARYGFELSEKLGLPVMLRMVTRLAHSRAVVEVDTEASAENEVSAPSNPSQWVLMPGNSRRRYPSLIADYERAAEISAESPFCSFTDAADHSRGIVVSGIAANYLAEAYPDGVPYPVVKVSQYPLPVKLIKKLFEACDEIVVIEEGMPFIEEHLRGALNMPPKPIRGKLDGLLPRTGELTPDCVAEAMTGNVADTQATPAIVMPRPPALCQGCGHRDVYAALNDALAAYERPRVFGDIGCYTLGYLKPFNAIDTCVDMGASITMAKGAADAEQHPAVAIIGDSTFTHSGMTGLLDAVNENSPITIIISDNLTTGMTGGQDSQGTGKLEDICLGLGLDAAHLHTIDSHPRTHDALVELLRKEIDYQGTSVIISRRECIQTARRHTKK